MKKNIVFFSGLFLLLFAFSIQPSLYADHCPYSAHDHRSLEAKFFHKAHFLIENQEKIGLTEDQIKTIKALKTDVMKNLLRQEAEIEVLAIDVQAKLWEDPVNVEETNKIIDQKYELKKAKTKSLVEAFAKLKGTLTEDQKNAMKAVWKKHRKV